MRLVLFDLDGTLTATNRVDLDCFVRTAREILGEMPLDTDWRHYTDTTDQAISTDLVKRARGKEDAGLVEEFKKRFIVHLEKEAADASLFAEIPGAGRLLAALAQAPGLAFGIATGAWRDSARLKLDRAGLDLAGAPLVTSDEAYTRIGIIEAAVARAKGAYSRESFSRITYVGDGPWDLLAARALGYSFLGVGRGERAEYFIKEGEGPVVPDYSDTEGVLALLS